MRFCTSSIIWTKPELPEEIPKYCKSINVISFSGHFDLRNVQFLPWISKFPALKKFSVHNIDSGQTLQSFIEAPPHNMSSLCELYFKNLAFCENQDAFFQSVNEKMPLLEILNFSFYMQQRTYIETEDQLIKCLKNFKMVKKIIQLNKITIVVNKEMVTGPTYLRKFLDIVNDCLPLHVDSFGIDAFIDGHEYIRKMKGQRAKMIVPQTMPASNVVNCKKRKKM